jgi:hypothetical protein
MIKIGANAGNAIGEIGKVNKALGDQMTSSQKAGVAIRKAAVPAGLALAALGAAAISCAKAAAEDEAAQVKLAGVLERTAGASESAIAATEDYITKLSLATGVADDELRPALAKLATATGSVTQAQQGLAVALDVSAATGKTTDQISKALAKAYAGNGAALAKLIPGIDEAAVKSGDFAKINKELARLTGGAAADAANTAAGQYKIFQLTIQETQEEIGMALLPVLKDLAPVLVRMATFVKDNSDLLVKFGAGIAAVAGAVVAINAIMTAFGAIMQVVKIAQAAATEDYITKLSLATGVADDELRPALAKLATATGSVTQAQQGLAVALDVSAATGKTTDQVSKALAKAYAGNGAALAKLIPGIDEAAVKSGDFATINKELARLTGGAAADAADTAAGQYKIFQLTLQETQEEIGMALLPVLKDLAPVLVRMAAFVKDNSDLLVKLGAGIAVVAGGIVAINAVMTAYTAVLQVWKAIQIASTIAQYAWNVAITANPIGLIIVAIAAVVAGLIIAYRESETFRRIVDTLFAAIKTGVSAALRPFIENWDSIREKIQLAWDLMKRFWPILLPGGAFYVAIREIEDRFGVFSSAIDAVRTAFGYLDTSIDKVKGAISGLWKAAQPVFADLKTAIGTYLTPLQRAFDAIRSVVDAIVTAISKIRLPKINLPGLGQIGGDSISAKSVAVSPVSQNINVTINGPIDADSTAREIRAVLQQYDIRYAI